MFGTVILFALIGYVVFCVLKDVPHNAEINRKTEEISKRNQQKTKDYFEKEYGWKIK